MAKGKRGGGQPKNTRRGSGEWRWLTPLIVAIFAVPLLALAAVWQSDGKMPALSLPALGTGGGAGPTGAPARTASPVAAAPARKTPVPTATATRKEVPTANPTKASTPVLTPTARPVATVPVAPTSTPAAKMVLKVPVYRQEHALSCEAASLRMALATFGLQLSEDKLLATLAKDPTPRKASGDSIVQWGDPDVGFVGAWDGKFLQDGYGVYEKPIAELAMAQGYEAVRYGKNVDPKELYAAVREGFPSIVWMPYDLAVKGRGSWVTPASKRIPYVVTEHAVVLAGIDPDGVYYADPMKPVLQYAPFAAFEKAIAELDSRYVTVRP